jgi:peptidoglycan/LPS O-acetylase OafA/YrhL
MPPLPSCTATAIDASVAPFGTNPVERARMNQFARFTPLRPDSDKMLHLDLLRFVASFGIVYHHSHEFFYSVKIRPAVIEASHGLALFVDLFFVISGFVIAFFYGDRVGSLREFGRFMQRRVARLWPLHLATLAAVILLSLLLGLAQISMNHPPALTARCVATTALLLHSVYDCGGIVFNGVSWSISTEMTMYLAFPLLVLILPKRGGGAGRSPSRLRFWAWSCFAPDRGKWFMTGLKCFRRYARCHRSCSGWGCFMPVSACRLSGQPRRCWRSA